MTMTMGQRLAEQLRKVADSVETDETLAEVPADLAEAVDAALADVAPEGIEVALTAEVLADGVVEVSVEHVHGETAADDCIDCEQQDLDARRAEIAARVGGETLAKYDAQQLRDMVKSGHAMGPADSPSYPVGDREDVGKAVHAVGRGNADHNAIRAHIIKNAKRLNASDLIPDDWNPDGSVKGGTAADESPEVLESGIDVAPGLPVAQDTPAPQPETAAIVIDPMNPGRFRSVLAVEGERTSDNRIIAPGAATWRTPPLPLMLMTKTDEGHDGAEVCGVIESISRQGNEIVGEGRFDTGTAGLEAARLVANKVLTGVSIDAGNVDISNIVEAEDEMGAPTKVLRQMDSLEIGCATICPFQAISNAKIEYVAPAEALAASALEAAAIDPSLAPLWDSLETVVAAAPQAFPAAFFTDPKFTELTTLHITPEGRVYGHAAPWGTCHTGIPGTCVTAPKSRTSYAHFLTGSVPLEDGTYQPVGRITIDTTHANQRLGPREATMHYDHTGAVAAFVNVGEDEFGIWVSGVLKPGIPSAMANALLGASLSGDWRKIGGNLELIGLLGVNVPGFPVAGTRRFAMDGEDEQISLVAAGYGPAQRTKQVLADQVDALGERTETRITELSEQLAAALDTVGQMRAQMAPLLRAHLAQRLNN